MTAADRGWPLPPPITFAEKTQVVLAPSDDFLTIFFYLYGFCNLKICFIFLHHLRFKGILQQYPPWLENMVMSIYPSIIALYHVETLFNNVDQNIFSLSSSLKVFRNTSIISILTWNRGDVNLSINHCVALYHVKTLFNNVDQVQVILEPWSYPWWSLVSKVLLSMVDVTCCEII